MSISTSRDVIVGQEPAPHPDPGPAAAARPASPLFRLRSAQPSRRAVVHLQATGDPVVQADLAAWFTERSCHFYLFGLRLPSPSLRPWRPGSHAAERAFAALDAVCAHVREADGVEHVIVSAQGRAAAVAARWCDQRGASELGRAMLSGTRQPAADALILYQPVWPARARVRLDISCPVLVLSGPVSRSLRPLRPGVAVHLGGHVTSVQLPGYTGLARSAGLAGVAGGPASRACFAELGRWLGAYMYGEPVGQLL